MIIVVRGLLGTGKTLLLSYFGYIEKTYSIIGNFELKVKNYKKITVYELEDISEKLVLLDEAYELFDSRNSNSEENKFFTKNLGFISRKRKCTVIIGCQLDGSIDLRFRGIADLTIEALGYSEKEKGFVYVLKTRLGRSKTFVLKIEIAEKLFPLFNTYEIPNYSTPTIYEPKRLNKYINEVIKILVNEYGEKAFSLTKGMINDFMTDYGKALPSKKMIESVYSRLRRMKLEKEN